MTADLLIWFIFAPFHISILRGPSNSRASIRQNKNFLTRHTTHNLKSCEHGELLDEYVRQFNYILIFIFVSFLKI